MTRDGQGEEWIKAHADYPHDDCCLIWPFGRNTTGYGVLTFEGERDYAHRAMCKHVNGEPPTPAHQAAHSCGRGHDACANHHHLSWKTPSENQQDRTDMRNRPKRKLTAENADDIRSCKGREKVTTTAERYGITEAAVRQIQAGKLWRESRRQEKIFTEAEVHRIRRETGHGQQAAIAREFGVSQTVVYRIKIGQTYAYIPPENPELKTAEGKPE